MDVFKRSLSVTLLAALGLSLSSCSTVDTLKDRFFGNKTGIPGTTDTVIIDTTPASLFERLGSKAAITAVVEELLIYVAEDPRISARFANTNLADFKIKLIDQICAATGGPCSYTGEGMRAVHADMALSDADFDALLDDLVKALNRFKVPQPEQKELLDILGPLRAEIVTV